MFRSLRSAPDNYWKPGTKLQIRNGAALGKRWTLDQAGANSIQIATLINWVSRSSEHYPVGYNPPILPGMEPKSNLQSKSTWASQEPPSGFLIFLSPP